MAAADIYQDVLFGLSGVKLSCIYELEPLKEVIPLSEMALLEAVAKIGEKFCEIKDFTYEVGDDPGVGFYALKCAERLNECLAPYCKTVADLHSDYSNLDYLYSRVYPYSELMSGLVMLVRELRTNQSKGASILEILEKHYNASVRAVHLAMKYIYEGVSEQLICHLKSWLLYGEVLDTKKEFFIQRAVSSNDSSNAFESFSLNFARVPSFIRPSVAERVLNVGQTVLFLRSRPEKKSGSSEELSIDSNGVSATIAERLSASFEDCGKEVPMAQWKYLERITEEVATLAMTQLHHLAMVDGGLVQQVHNIKDVLLMGRGELFHEFVRQTEIAISNGSTMFLDVNLLLRACASKVLIREETLSLFTLEMLTGEDGSQLNVVYAVPWPLELLFTREVIDQYNHIFRFLLRLKKVQVRMVGAWLRDKRKRKLVWCAKRRQLQQNLWFLVNNLQYYLQVDVLESQYVSFEAAVVASDNFEEIRLAHAKFLANLVEQSFLSSQQDSADVTNPVQQRLNNILMLCEEFCLQAERKDDEEMSVDVVDCLTVKFDACFQRLFALLEALKKHAGHPGSQHLGQLLLRLDFNRFFSSNSLSCINL